MAQSISEPSCHAWGRQVVFIGGEISGRWRTWDFELNWNRLLERTAEVISKEEKKRERNLCIYLCLNAFSDSLP
jgi:hypothetical protein